MNAYFVALLVIALPLFVAARRPLDTCAGVMILNWVLVVVFNHFFGTYTPWVWFLALDSGCALLMMLYRHGDRWPVIVALPYVFMILCHFRFAYADGNWSQHDYWSALLWSAWAQMGLLSLYGGSRLVSLIAPDLIRPAVGGNNNYSRESSEK